MILAQKLYWLYMADKLELGHIVGLDLILFQHSTNLSRNGTGYRELRSWHRHKKQTNFLKHGYHMAVNFGREDLLRGNLDAIHPLQLQTHLVQKPLFRHYSNSQCSQRLPTPSTTPNRVGSTLIYYYPSSKNRIGPHSCAELRES
jgi:hypothetical protein